MYYTVKYLMIYLLKFHLNDMVCVGSLKNGKLVSSDEIEIEDHSDDGYIRIVGKVSE